MVIEENRGKQAELERRARSEPLNDLPRAEIFFVRVGAHQIEVQLIGVHFAEEVAAAGEVFEIEEFVFFEAFTTVSTSLW